MDHELTGFSALLKAKIDQIEDEIRMLASAGISTPTDAQDSRAQHLEALREELEEELESREFLKS